MHHTHRRAQRMIPAPRGLGLKAAECLALSVAVAGTKSLCWTGPGHAFRAARSCSQTPARHPGLLARWRVPELVFNPFVHFGGKKIETKTGEVALQTSLAEEGRRLEKLELPVVTLGCCSSSPRSEGLAVQGGRMPVSRSDCLHSGRARPPQRSAGKSVFLLLTEVQSWSHRTCSQDAGSA